MRAVSSLERLGANNNRSFQSRNSLLGAAAALTVTAAGFTMTMYAVCTQKKEEPILKQADPLQKNGPILREESGEKILMKQKNVSCKNHGSFVALELDGSTIIMNAPPQTHIDTVEYSPESGLCIRATVTVDLMFGNTFKKPGEIMVEPDIMKILLAELRTNNKSSLKIKVPYRLTCEPETDTIRQCAVQGTLALLPNPVEVHFECIQKPEEIPVAVAMTK